MGWIFKSSLFDKSPDKYGTVGVTELSNVAESGGYPEMCTWFSDAIESFINSSFVSPFLE